MFSNSDLDETKYSYASAYDEAEEDCQGPVFLEGRIRRCNRSRDCAEEQPGNDDAGTDLFEDHDD